MKRHASLFPVYKHFHPAVDELTIKMDFSIGGLGEASRFFFGEITDGLFHLLTHHVSHDGQRQGF
ncbi:MAG: hypothetical protein IIY54_08470, partial [Ruminococcus sp.]|nr:hypothetical protein [Ruminococcus sp.]